MERLTGRVALVTGAAGGIGSATAVRLAAEGAAVLVTDVADAQSIVDRIVASGGRAAYVRHDVTSESEWSAAVSAAVDQFGRLDILVNNAGIGDRLSLEETPLDNYERVIAITQTSVFLGMKAAAAALHSSGNGSVINISSIFGSSGGFGSSPAYHAAKGAVRAITKTTALHWATTGVRVNSIHPGFIKTPMLDESMGTPAEQMMFDLTPMGHLGRPEDIAAGVAYLASDDAAFVTGSELYIDGGYMAR
jgi:NAD(P)-dependent dehydrogenase (short-subunit alcohol dehydrogenase family)